MTTFTAMDDCFDEFHSTILVPTIYLSIYVAPGAMEGGAHHICGQNSSLPLTSLDIRLSTRNDFHGDM